MQGLKTHRKLSIGLLLAGSLVLIGALGLPSGNAGAATTFEFSGFAMLDMGYQAGQSDPDWFDVLRPTKLPSFEDEYGKDGRFFAGVRQSRFGVRSSTPITDKSELKTIFEFELFGTGVDAGQTTFRIRHAWGELGHFGAGQTNSVFIDPDAFPNSIEYWGPNGLAWFRNVQARWMPIQGDSHLWIAVERPGASGDLGVYADRIQLQGVQPRFPVPDFTGQFRLAKGWGHIQAAGLVRYLKWDDLNDDEFDLSDNETGWGVNLSSNLKIAKDVVRLQVVYGEGIENYMNDAPVDIGVETQRDPEQPFTGQALPVTGVSAFLDHTWSDKATTSIGYSRLDIDNSNGQADDAFKSGQYALVNVLYYPTANLMLGPEVQWGTRENKDGWDSDDVRVQFSFKYSFKYLTGGM